MSPSVIGPPEELAKTNRDVERSRMASSAASATSLSGTMKERLWCLPSFRSSNGGVHVRFAKSMLAHLVKRAVSHRAARRDDEQRAR